MAFLFEPDNSIRNNGPRFRTRKVDLSQSPIRPEPRVHVLTNC